MNISQHKKIKINYNNNILFKKYIYTIINNNHLFFISKFKIVIPKYTEK